MTDPIDQALEANAYSITYRLLGDRPAALAASRIAAEQVRRSGRPDGTGWLDDVAREAVRQSVGAATLSIPRVQDGAEVVDPDAGLRAALRRRLAQSAPDERAAAALHHLAGYPIEDVAAFMGVEPDRARRWAAVLAPPPGVSYRPLGDPEVVRPGPPREPSEAARHRRRGGVGRWLPIVSGVVLVAVVVGLVVASRDAGDRPGLASGTTTTLATGTGSGVPPLPSAGCERDPATPGVSDATVSTPSGDRAYRLAVPAAVPGVDDEAPHGVVIGLPGYSQPAVVFNGTTGLENAAGARGYILATLEPVDPGRELSPVPQAGRDDLAAVLAVTDAVITEQCVDLRRVNVVGFGPGGQLAGAAACAAPELFASAAGVAGAHAPADCALDPPVSLYLEGSADDTVLPVAGGYGPGMAVVAPSVPPPARVDAVPPGEVAARWAGLIGAADEQVQTRPSGASLVTYTGGRDGTAVQVLTQTSGGHTWKPATSERVMQFLIDHARVVD